MLLASQLCFSVFLASLPSTQAEGNSFPLFISRHNNNSLAYESGFINNTRCSWNCTIIDSDFPKHWKTVSINDRVIKVVVEYERKVTRQCATQASRNTSGNGIEYFNVWLPANNMPSNFDHAVQSVLDLVTSSSIDERVKIKAACDFIPLRANSVELAFSALTGDFLSQSVRSHLADHGFNVKRSNDCNAEMANLQPCISMNNSTVNSTVDNLIHGSLLLNYCMTLVVAFLATFVYYSPAYICLFYPTVITENGLHQIVVEGASPVSFRSLVANYYHHTEHGARMLLLRLVLLPLPFLPPVIVTLNQLPQPPPPQLELLMIVLLVCYVVKAIHSSFFKVSQKAVKPCIVCRFVKPNLTCDVEPRRRMLNHLRMQPLILIKCWWCFRKYLMYYLKLSRVILPARRNMSLRWFFRVAGFLVFLSTIPAVTSILFAAMIMVGVICVLFTAPVNVLSHDDMACSDNASLLNGWPVLVVTRLFIRPSATAGAILYLSCAAFGLMIIFVVFFGLLLNEHSLPFVVLFVLVCYYLWSSYSSFTNQYHDLSLILFKRYQERRSDRIVNEAAAAGTADFAQDEELTPNPENEGKVIKIPKELFDIACEELMPIRESVCLLGLKVIVILMFVFLILVVVMTIHVRATPMMRALVTFLTGSLPKVVTIYIDGGRKQKLEAMVIEERALRIVKRYLHRTASSDQEQDISGTHTEEVIIFDENEESIQLVNMETSQATGYKMYRGSYTIDV